MASNAPTVHDRIAQGLKEHPAKKGMLFNILVTVVEIGGSIALFHLAQRLGASDVASYLVGSIGPVVGGFMIWAKARKFSGASAAIFTFTVVSAIIALAGSTTPKVLLYKDCVATALIGLIFLGSCFLAHKPVVFYMAQRHGTDGTHDGMAIFDTMWDTYHEFRRGMYVISYLWAALFLLQAAGTALIIRQAKYSTAYNYDQILPLVATALGIVGSIAISRYFTKKGRARGAAANAAQTEPA
jgi:hypothetical protein